MKKRILFALIVLFAAALVFTGCEPAAGGSAGGAGEVWLCSLNVPAHTADPSDPDDFDFPAYTMDSMKIVITGNTYKMYTVSYQYYVAVYLWAMDQSQPKPAAVFDDEPDDEGTITFSGNTVTIVTSEGNMTGTVSGNTMTFENPDYDPAHPDPESPQYLVFTKQ